MSLRDNIRIMFANMSRNLFPKPEPAYRTRVTLWVSEGGHTYITLRRNADLTTTREDLRQCLQLLQSEVNLTQDYRQTREETICKLLV